MLHSCTPSDKNGVTLHPVTDIKLPNLHSAGQASNQSNDTGHHPPAALSTVISPCFTRASRSFVSEPQRHTCPVLRPPTLCHRLRASAAARCNAPLLLPCAAHSSSMCRHTAARLLEEWREEKGLRATHRAAAASWEPPPRREAAGPQKRSGPCIFGMAGKYLAYLCMQCRRSRCANTTTQWRLPR